MWLKFSGNNVTWLLESTAFRRALITVITTSLAVIGVVTMPPTSASAVEAPAYNVVDRPATAVTGDPLPTVQIDGVVWTQVTPATRSTRVASSPARARPGRPTTNETPRGNLLSFDIRTGQLNTDFAPSLNGTRT